jgi:hypothetical protein
MIEEIKKFQVFYLTSIAERLEITPKSIDDDLSMKIKQRQQEQEACRSKVELVLIFGSQFSEFIFTFSGPEF